MSQPPPLPPNPLQYQQPLPGPAPGQYAACPRCGCPYASAVTFTWWGGLLGPKILSHVKCHHCGHSYNGKTGKDNTTAIVIYSLVGVAIGIALLAGFLLFAWSI